MTDQEYRAYLLALAKKYLRVRWAHRVRPPGAIERLIEEIWNDSPRPRDSYESCGTARRIPCC